jgi:hypothetical protein
VFGVRDHRMIRCLLKSSFLKELNMPH